MEITFQIPDDEYAGALDAICARYDYQASRVDADGNTIEQSKDDFFIETLYNFADNHRRSFEVEQAVNAAKRLTDDSEAKRAARPVFGKVVIKPAPIAEAADAAVKVG